MTDSLSMVPFHVRQAMRIHPARLLASLSAVVLLVGCYDLTLNPYMGGDGGQDEAGSFDAIDAQASMGGSTGAGGTGDTTGTGGDTGGGAAGGGGVGGAISSGGGGDAGVPDAPAVEPDVSAGGTGGSAGGISGASGTSDGGSVGAVIVSFTAWPKTITAGRNSTLSWTATGATMMSIDPGVGAVTGVAAGSRATPEQVALASGKLRPGAIGQP